MVTIREGRRSLGNEDIYGKIVGSQEVKGNKRQVFAKRSIDYIADGETGFKIRVTSPVSASLGDDEDFGGIGKIRESSDEKLLANALYIFIILVFFTIVIAVVAFGVREFYLSTREKTRSALGIDQRDVKDVYESTETSVTGESVSVEANETVAARKERNSLEKPSGQNLVQDGDCCESGVPSEDNISPSVVQEPDSYPCSESDDPGPHPWGPLSSSYTQSLTIRASNLSSDESATTKPTPVENKPQLRDNPKRHDRNKEQPDVFGRIDVLSGGLSSPELADGSINRFLHSGFTEESFNQYDRKPRSAKKIYTIRELNRLKDSARPTQILNNDLSKFVRVKMSDIMRFSIPFPQTNFDSAWQADKLINEVRSILACDRYHSNTFATRQTALVTALSIGASNKLLDNPNYFLSTFNDFIETIVDTGAIFDILDDTNRYCQILLIEMIIMYCWSHWNFKKKSTETVQHKLSSWKINEPLIQKRSTIFRFLCNIELGIHAVQNLEYKTRLEAELKTQALLKDAAKSSFCNDYLSFIPMLAQGVDISKRASVKHLFYDVLFLLVQKHCSCCMKEYLSDDEIDLKALVQHGLWQKNDQSICNKAKDIFKYLILRNPSIQSWWTEISGGEKYVSSALPFNVSLTSTDNAASALRPTTPGSLRFTNEISNRATSASIRRSTSLRNILR
ncbi:Piso0_002341 [Millerozyma farinosa CBS 7064]|uniref:Piso0_002341 protein n=1 Tax=Pichia sorbitophila (strain ATCC MYA-4447 / BCRC 22081 / CBS 7064 / NBRC 10061 / NRRL Y-12695) TaxID=559304 RepID=G8YES9_PICSO|nr:Piso0_002341 [Millerozyma farinosa CBS 7064]